MSWSPSPSHSDAPKSKRAWLADRLRLHWSNPAHPDDEEAFWVHRAEVSARSWRILFLASALFVVLWWPTDLWLYAKTPEAIRPFAVARGFTASSLLLMSVLLKRVEFFRARPVLSMAVLGHAISFVAAWQFGSIAGPTQVWFHFTHLFVLGPIAITMRRGQRVVLTSLLACSLLAGLFVMTPRNLSDPLAGATVSWLVFLTVLGISSGFFADGLRRREFFQRCEAVRLAKELDAVKNSLERQVEARTREVRELGRHLESARERERARIARDLHDDLGQELTALRYAVELTRRRCVKSPESSGIGSNVAEIGSLADRARLTLRSILSDLRPRVLDDLGFVAASAWLVQQVRERTGLPIEFVHQGDDARLSSELSTTVYRVLQEALGNATRHAKANKVRVRLELGASFVALEVTDDGIGFDPAGVGRERFGLLGMRERAAASGGHFEVASERGKGTRVHLMLPLEPMEMAS